MTEHRYYFSTLEQLDNPSTVVLSSNVRLTVNGISTIQIKNFIPAGWFDSVIENVLFVPELKRFHVFPSGIKWHNRRKMLTPAFHFKILEEHVPALNQMTNILTQKLMACTSDDTPVDIHKFITLCSLDIICGT
uniref:Retrovirus-related Pol polyprotein from transposon TNT 1-94-like beta-barrel domain-containing protein n=1 Tax=Timema monikensis TaxID=170555 RepID=A0A7R9E6I5_9NEOP|nr:unnamed protein product [Timema monikensis]